MKHDRRPIGFVIGGNSRVQGLKRKLVYVTFYELIGLCMSTL
ncbi:transmembrane pair domain-containing protein, partial [Pseudomonas putida S11]